MSDDQPGLPASPQVSPDGRFWWDGQAWQPMQTGTAADHGKNSKKNTLGTVSLVVAIIGFIFACIPGALIVGWVLLPVAFVLSLVALIGGGKTKGRALAGLIVSIVGTIVGFVVFFSVVDDAFTEAFDESGLSSSDESGPSASGESSDSPANTFEDNVLTTPDVRIEITDSRVIGVGEAGNEFGEKPVVAFAYEITNVSGEEVDPLAWITYFTAEQDNDPNAVNELNVGGLPDDRFLDSQTEKIKEGGTVENAIAYELDDETTPVELIASDDLGMTEIGRISYDL